MKKKIFLSAALVAAIALGCYNGFSTTATNENLSDIQLANIEALASGEYIVGTGWECFNIVFDDVTNPNFVTIIDCSTCHITTAVYINQSAYCKL